MPNAEGARVGRMGRFSEGVLGVSQWQLEDQGKWVNGGKELRQVLRRAESCHLAPYISWPFSCVSSQALPSPTGKVLVTRHVLLFYVAQNYTREGHSSSKSPWCSFFVLVSLLLKLSLTSLLSAVQPGDSKEVRDRPWTRTT